MEIQDFAYTGNELTKKVNTSQTTYARTDLEDGTLRGDPFNGVITFHFEDIARQRFVGSAEQVPGSYFLYRDGNICSKFGICIGTQTEYTHYVISRGVAQYGEEEHAPINKILTRMKTLKYYEGYPVSMAFTKAADIRNIDVYYRKTRMRSPVDPELKDIFFGNPEIFVFDLSDVTDNGFVGIEMEQEVTDERAYKACKVPTNPFYVRWINNMGGYDYHMFSCNRKYMLKLTINDYYEKYGTNGETASIRKDGVQYVEASTGLTDIDTLQEIAKMPFSPMIQLWDKKGNKWIPLQIESGDSELLTGQSTGELVFTFVLPTLKTNK